MLKKVALTTQGDLLYYGGTRFQDSIRNEGQVLSVVSKWYSRMERFPSSAPDVYYVAGGIGTDNPDSTNGETLGSVEKTIRYACEEIEKRSQ